MNTDTGNNKTPAKQAMKYIIALLLAFAGWELGYHAGRQTVQSANELLSVGFTIIDPEGFPIHHFDE